MTNRIVCSVFDTSDRRLAWETSPREAPRWDDLAACKGTPEDDNPFFDEKRWGEARQICLGCEVRDECLDDALVRGDLQWFRAGLTPKGLVAVADLVKRPRVVRACIECAGRVTGRGNWCSTTCKQRAFNRARRNSA